MPTATAMMDLPKTYVPAEHEESIRHRWEASGVFHAVPRREGDDRRSYCILIPLPNVTAALHLGHALNNTLQDVLTRYHRMQGRNTLWMPGTDHAGIATQTVVEQRLLRTEGKRRIDYQRDEFVAIVQKWKDEYEATITAQLKAFGCSCDWDRQRFTMDEVCARAVREAFFQFFKEGLIYRGKRLVNWDPATQTALADDEVEMQEIKGHFWYLKYPIVNDVGKDTGEYVTVATTRPETMLGDTAVAVNPNDPPRAKHAGMKVRLPIVNRIIPIIEDDYVVIPDPSSDDAKAQYATGFLKVTPAHDPNDWEIGQRHNLDVINILAPDASISRDHGWPAEEFESGQASEAEQFLGMSREDASKAVAQWFDDHDLLEDVRDYAHSVGHSYRSHVAIEPYLSDQWYLKVTDDRLVGEAQRALCREQFEGNYPPRVWEPADAGASPKTGGTGVSPVRAQEGEGPEIGGTGVSPVRAQEGALTITRRNLPHWRIDGSTYFVTFRVKQGTLTEPERQIALDAALHWHSQRAQVHLVTVMPNHVHLLIAPTRKPDGSWWPLSELLHSIKSYSAHEIQKRRGAAGELWQDESFDRVVRDDEEFLEKWNYMAHNPVEAGLARSPEEYAFTARGAAASAFEASAAVTGETPVPPTHVASAAVTGETPVPPHFEASAAVTGETPVPPANRSQYDGGLKFYPPRYAKMYQSWHVNLRDWCISRQLWWGHRIPVWSRFWTDEELATRRPQAAPPHTRPFPDPPESVIADRWEDTDDSTHSFQCERGTDGYWLRVCIAPGYPQLEEILNEGGYEQDPDVLDTWFSSAVWPLSTMGWPNPADFPETLGLLETFNPTSVLVTAREIITLWVSRMVMFNRFFNDGKLPYEHVYIHPMIQDGHGQRMSKSLGNGVDPRDIIHSHGSDALRFIMAQMATSTQDVRLPVDTVCPHCETVFHPKEITSPAGYRVAAPHQECPHCQKKSVTVYGRASGAAEPTETEPLARNTSAKFDLGRNFCNKLWNASRFALSNLGSGDGAAERRSDEGNRTLADRWILSRLYHTVQAVEAAVAEYQFNVYAETMYDFIWRDFCDWYLEAIKPTVHRDAAQRRVLQTVLNATLRLLHPICPFVTETLWKHVHAAGGGGLEGAKLPDNELLAGAPWPQVAPMLEDNDAEALFARIQALVLAVRTLRAQHNVAPKKKIVLSVTALAGELVAAANGVVETLCMLEHMKPIDNERPAGAIPLAFEGQELIVSGVIEDIDIVAERRRLQKRAAEKEKAIGGYRKKLSNPAYVNNAPAHIVEETRMRLAEAEADLAAARKALESIGEPGGR